MRSVYCWHSRSGFEPCATIIVIRVYDKRIRRMQLTSLPVMVAKAPSGAESYMAIVSSTTPRTTDSGVGGRERLMPRSNNIWYVSGYRQTGMLELCYIEYAKLSGNARRFKTIMGMSLQEFDLLLAKVEKTHPETERDRLSKRPQKRAIGASTQILVCSTLPSIASPAHSCTLWARACRPYYYFPEARCQLPNHLIVQAPFRISRPARSPIFARLCNSTLWYKTQ